MRRHGIRCLAALVVVSVWAMSTAEADTEVVGLESGLVSQLSNEKCKKQAAALANGPAAQAMAGEANTKKATQERAKKKQGARDAQMKKEDSDPLNLLLGIVDDSK